MSLEPTPEEYNDLGRAVLARVRRAEFRRRGAQFLAVGAAVAALATVLVIASGGMLPPRGASDAQIAMGGDGAAEPQNGPETDSAPGTESAERDVQTAAPFSAPNWASAVDPGFYLCGDDRVPRSAIDDPLRISDLDAAGQEAIASATYDDGSKLELDDAEKWIVADRSETRIVLLRMTEVTPAAAVDSEESASEHDYERIALTTELWPGWAVGASGGCTLTVDLGALGVPYVWMDADALPTKESRELRLLVSDPSCGGDTDMPGRIEVVGLEEGSTEIRLLLGVRPLPAGAYDCGGFPPTPYTLELSAPLGDREVVDDSRPIMRVLFENGLLDADR